MRAPDWERPRIVNKSERKLTRTIASATKHNQARAPDKRIKIIPPGDPDSACAQKIIANFFIVFPGIPLTGYKGSGTGGPTGPGAACFSLGLGIQNKLKIKILGAGSFSAFVNSN